MSLKPIDYLLCAVLMSAVIPKTVHALEIIGKTTLVVGDEARWKVDDSHAECRFELTDSQKTKSVVSVTTNGVLKGNAVGSSRIKAICFFPKQNGERIPRRTVLTQDVFVVAVPPRVTEIEIVLPHQDRPFMAGETAYLQVQAYGSRHQLVGAELLTCLWGSSNTSVADISPDGKLTAHVSGKTVIKVACEQKSLSLLEKTKIITVK